MPVHPITELVVVAVVVTLVVSGDGVGVVAWVGVGVVVVVIRSFVSFTAFPKPQHSGKRKPSLARFPEPSYSLKACFVVRISR